MSASVVVYERTGGFVGIQQRLELDPARRTVKFNDRRTGGGERALSDEEAARVTELVARAQGAEVPATSAENARVSDSFTLRLWLGESQPAVTLSTLSVPLGKGEGSPWGELLSFVDRLLESELARSRPKGAPQILSAEDLEK